MDLLLYAENQTQSYDIKHYVLFYFTAIGLTLLWIELWLMIYSR